MHRRYKKRRRWLRRRRNPTKVCGFCENASDSILNYKGIDLCSSCRTHHYNMSNNYYRRNPIKYRRNTDEDIRSLERRFHAGDTAALPLLKAAYRRAGRELDFTDQRLSYLDQIRLISAIEMDHPCDDNTSCDIAAAITQGFPEVAAHLLGSATEAENLDKAILPPCQCEEPDPRTGYYDDCAICGYCQLPINGEGIDIYGSNILGERHPWPRGWGAWVAWHTENAIQCSCGGYNYPNEYGSPSSCGDCGNALPEDVEEDY